MYVYFGTFTLEGGEISDNTAKGVDGERFGGGGIYLYRMTTSMPGGTFTLKDGMVSGNKAKYGGGIWTSNFSAFTMSGGTFSGNTATNKGNGAYVNPGCTFKMSGAAQFAESDDVYLYATSAASATITVAGALTAESPVATITPSAYELDRQVLSAGVTIDSAVCAQFALTSNPDIPDAEWKIMPDSTGANGVLKAKMDIYVRGSNAAWYASNAPTAANGSDTNAGTLLAPLATIQAAVEKIIAMNDGASAYTIYVDGTLDGATPGAHLGADGMADCSALSQNLTLTIKALSGTATLDAGGKSRVIKARPAGGILNLTLENLTITGGNTATGTGGGIDFVSAGGALTMTGCVVRGNEAGYGGGVYGNGGTFTMEGGTISGNTATTSGGGVFINGSAFTMESGTISGNTANTNGGGVYVKGSTFTMKGGTISDNKATGYYGGGVHIESGTFTMSGGARKSRGAKSK